MYSKRHQRRLVSGEIQKILGTNVNEEENSANSEDFITNDNEGNIFVQNVVKRECGMDSNCTDVIMKKLDEISAEINKKLDDQSSRINEQSEIIQKLLRHQAESSVLIKTMLKQVPPTVEFPMQTLSQLNEINDKIAENREKYLRIFEILIKPTGLARGLSKILGKELVMELNYDGLQNMVAFRKFENIHSVLYEVVQNDGYTKEDYATDIKKGIKLYKDRIRKANSIAKPRCEI